VDYPVYNREYGVKCSNPRCVTWQETEKNYLKPQFKIVSLKPLTFRCIYCEHGTEPKYVASTEWQPGDDGRQALQPGQQPPGKENQAGNLIAFDSAEEAEKHGYLPGHYAQSQAVEEKPKNE